MRRILVPDTITPVLPAPGCAVTDFRGESMGTSWTVRVVQEKHRQGSWQNDIQAQLDNVVAEMSHWEADSNLGRFNRAAAGSWHDLPGGFFDVLCHAMEVAEQSGGAYDPTSGALVNLWGFGPGRGYDDDAFAIPDAHAIECARQSSGWQRVAVDREHRRAFQPGGVQLDLSAIAKGYAVDCIARHLEKSGIPHFLVEVGGELRGGGLKPDCLPWWVSLEVPPDVAAPEKAGETIVALHNIAIATSGDYRRFYRHGNARMAHTIDPRTGYPLQNGVASVTVLHPSCMAADALSTALTVLGPEDGLCFAGKLGIAARFLTRTETGFVEHTTPAFDALLQ